MLPTPFGTTWEELTLKALKAFFASAGDEGLTWEAKGGLIRPEHIRQSASAFGNSELGGFLVLGASQAKRTPGRPWTVEGYTFPTEPATWVSTCLMNHGVRPRPSFDVAAWPLAGDRHVAVVNFRTVPVPPVITGDGQVWERLSGVSLQVKDPATMLQLTGRGEAARQQAKRTCEDGAYDMRNAPPLGRPSGIVLAMASPALAGDVSPLVFRQSAYKAATEILNGQLAMPALGGYVQNRVGGDVSQHAITLWNAGVDESEGRAIRIGRHGSIVVAASSGLIESGLSNVAGSTKQLERLWKAASGMMTSFVTEAPVHVVIALRDETKGETTLARWANVPGPSEDDLSSIQREARRARGEPVWEPESEEGQEGDSER